MRETGGKNIYGGSALNIAKDIHKLNYKRLSQENKPKSVTQLPPGIWVPVTVAAILLGCTSQTVYLLRITRQIKSIKFKRGPMLVDLTGRIKKPA